MTDGVAPDPDRVVVVVLVRMVVWVVPPLPLPPLPPEPPPDPDPAELARLLDAWNPLVPAVIGFGAFAAILWLMLFKPF